MCQKIPPASTIYKFVLEMEIAQNVNPFYDPEYRLSAVLSQ